MYTSNPQEMQENQDQTNGTCPTRSQLRILHDLCLSQARTGPTCGLGAHPWACSPASGCITFDAPLGTLSTPPVAFGVSCRRRRSASGYMLCSRHPLGQYEQGVNNEMMGSLATKISDVIFSAKGVRYTPQNAADMYLAAGPSMQLKHNTDSPWHGRGVA